MSGTVIIACYKLKETVEKNALNNIGSCIEADLSFFFHKLIKKKLYTTSWWPHVVIFQWTKRRKLINVTCEVIKHIGVFNILIKRCYIFYIAHFYPFMFYHLAWYILLYQLFLFLLHLKMMTWSHWNVVLQCMDLIGVWEFLYLQVGCLGNKPRALKCLALSVSLTHFDAISRSHADTSITHALALFW